MFQRWASSGRHLSAISVFVLSNTRTHTTQNVLKIMSVLPLDDLTQQRGVWGFLALIHLSWGSIPQETLLRRPTPTCLTLSTQFKDLQSKTTGWKIKALRYEGRLCNLFLSAPLFNTPEFVCRFENVKTFINSLTLHAFSQVWDLPCNETQQQIMMSQDKDADVHMPSCAGNKGVKHLDGAERLETAFVPQPWL